MKVAKKNLVKAQVDEFVTMTEQDIRQNEDTVPHEFDVAIVDLGDPWTAVEAAYNALKGSGVFLGMSYNRIRVEKKTSISLKNNHFTDIECVEIRILILKLGKV